MRTLIEQLADDRRSLLLMYEAGELPDAQRAQVEQMLAGDESLRRELDEIRAAQQTVDSALAQLDAAQPVSGSAAAAARQFRRAAQQWHIDRATRVGKAELRRSLRFPWWSYPLTTAAAITIAAVVWWWTLPPAPTQLNPDQIARAPVMPDRAAAGDIPQFAGIAQLESMAELSPYLAEAEAELRAIEVIRESWQ